MSQGYAWADISFKALEHNVRELRKKIGENRALAAVVKSDAYGHGMIAISRALQDMPVDFLAVATVFEGITLRKNGIEHPVMILERTLPDEYGLLLDNDLIPVLHSLKEAPLLSNLAQKRGCAVRVHVQINTGMNRFGIPLSCAQDTIETISALPGITLEGVCSHLATADEEHSPLLEKQVDVFTSVYERIVKTQPHIRYFHLANSAAALAVPGAYFSMVRCGLSLYGYYPGPENPFGVNLRPVLTLKSRVLHTQQVKCGDNVSYGAAWTAKKDTRVAVIGIGYGEGYPRAFSNCGEILIHGGRYPVVGRVCMNCILVDVGTSDAVTPGDEAVIYGSDGNEAVRMEDAALKINTIPYELTCRIHHSVLRVYRS